MTKWTEKSEKETQTNLPGRITTKRTKLNYANRLNCSAIHNLSRRKNPEID